MPRLCLGLGGVACIHTCAQRLERLLPWIALRVPKPAGPGPAPGKPEHLWCLDLISRGGLALAAHELAVQWRRDVGIGWAEGWGALV